VTDRDYVAYEQKARSLLKSGDVNGAIDVLQTARSNAQRRSDHRKASDLSGWIGSLFLSIGRIDNALQAFETAERDEPDNPHHKIVSAEQLLSLTDNVEEALRKLREIENRLPTNASTRHHFYDLLGRAYLRLGRRDEAVEAFHSMASDELIRKVSPRGLCLNLVRSFIAEGAMQAECKRYLNAVESKARIQNDADVAATAAELGRRL
jgi:tetratricopeptide (TPR) repeat protein